MDRLLQKTSTVLVASGGDTKVFRSVSDVPPRLRKKLLEATGGKYSATILIADEAGRKEIVKSLEGAQTGLESRLIRSLARQKMGIPIEPETPKPLWKGLTRRQWTEVGLLFAIAGCLWLLAVFK